MASYFSPNVKVKKSKLEGGGLFASGDIKKGELIADFTNGLGKIISIDEAEKLYKKGFDYMLQISDTQFSAATKEEELEAGDYLNHSCEPNCGINGKLKVVAMRDIKKGEEITFDYAMSESSEFKMKCNCKSKNCRKVITGVYWKRKD